MSAPMVRALLAGTKSQTRRIVKPQPDVSDWKGIQRMFGFAGGNRSKPFGDWHQWRIVGPDYPDSDKDDIWCPWAAGELLWVRESIYQFGGAVEYAADAGAPSFPRLRTPSIHMPRWASRLTLHITDVRVQRLQEIGEADAIAEGWKSYEIIHRGKHKGQRHPHAVVPNRSPITSYKELWESINGAGSWAANPWVWAITFDVIKQRHGDIDEWLTEHI
jgi:hypothetical protein